MSEKTSPVTDMAELDEAAIFNAARKIEDPDQRAAYLRQSCGDDREMYERVVELLRIYDQERDFLESRPAEFGPQLELASVTEGPGTVIGRYKLLELIGEGGFAVVYMAEQTEPIHRQVALKIIKLGMDTRQVIARFEAERQALAMMDHPSIAEVYDAGATDTGRPYFVMQLIRGIPITEYCDENRLTTEARLRLFLEVCHAVQHAHQKGIIHRDIKPSNVLVALHDGRPVPKVIDFGIAKATHQRLTEKTLYTSYRQIIGTPQYMSPEQAEFSDLDIDTRSDIYSLGVLLYELLTSTTPFQSSELGRMGYDEICRTILHSEPPTPSRRLSALGDAATAAKNRQIDPAGLRKLLRGDLDCVVMKCLEKDRTRRYATASDLAADLIRHLTDEPVVARAPSTVYRLQRAIRRNRTAFTAITVVVASLLVGIGFSTWQAIEARKAQTEAQRLLYISDVNAAGHAWENNDIGLFESILTSLVGRSNFGRHDFAMRYLQHQYQTFAETPRLKTMANVAVAFSPEGTELAVGHAHGRVTVWHKTGDGWLKGDTFGESDDSRWYTSIAFSPREKPSLTLAYPHKNTIRLRNVSSGEEYTLPEIHEGAVWDVAFSKDGRFLASGGADKKVILWEVASRRVRRILAAHTDSVQSVAFSPTEPILASGSKDKTVRLWHYMHENEQSQVLLRNSGPVLCVEFSPDGAYLASGSADNTAVICDLKAKTSKTLYGHRDEVRSLGFSLNQELLATGSRDKTVKLWRMPSCDEIATLHGCAGYTNCLAFAPSGELLATGGPNKDVLLWNVRANFRANLLSLPGRVPLDTQSVHFLPGTENELVVCCTSRTPSAASLSSELCENLLFWNPDNGDVRREDLAQPISALAVSADGKLLATAQNDDKIQLCQLPLTGALKPSLTLSNPDGFHEISALAFTADSRFLIAGTRSGDLVAWDAQTGNIFLTRFGAHTARIGSIVCASDNSVFASGGWDNDVKLWALHTGASEQPVRSFHHDSYVMCLAFSTDGRRIAVGTYEGSPIVIHHVDSNGGNDARLVGHEFAVKGLAFSHDDATLFSSGGDGQIKLWDVATGRQRLVLDGHTSAFACMTLSPDEQALATADRAGQIRIWRAPRHADFPGAE